MSSCAGRTRLLRMWCIRQMRALQQDAHQLPVLFVDGSLQHDMKLGKGLVGLLTYFRVAI